MTNSGFIFMLVLGASILTGMIITAHVSSHGLAKRIAARRAAAAAKEPELDLIEPQ